jgi:HSP20 family protein
MLSIVKREPRFGWGLMNLRDEMNRMFNNFYEDFDQAESRWVPSVDILEEKDSLRLSAELPGVDKKDVRINIQNGILTIEGEKKQESEKKEDDYYRTERFYGKFTRSFTLPSGIDAENVKADFRDGILHITLPKTEKAKPRQIEIK